MYRAVHGFAKFNKIGCIYRNACAAGRGLVLLPDFVAAVADYLTGLFRDVPD
jgi:hypothetical protein